MKRLVRGFVLSLLLATASGSATDLTAYRLTTDGLGAIRIGMSSAQIAKAGFRLGSPDHGNKECGEYPLAGHKGITLLFQNDRLTSVLVSHPGIKTLSGAHVGMYATQVERLYGKKLEVLRFADLGEEGGGGTMRIYSNDRNSSVVFLTNEDQTHGTKQQPVIIAIRSGPAADQYESCV